MVHQFFLCLPGKLFRLYPTAKDRHSGVKIIFVANLVPQVIKSWAKECQIDQYIGKCRGRGTKNFLRANGWRVTPKKTCFLGSCSLIGAVLKPLMKQLGKWYCLSPSCAEIGKLSLKLKISSTTPLGMMCSFRKDDKRSICQMEWTAALTSGLCGM